MNSVNSNSNKTKTDFLGLSKSILLCWRNGKSAKHKGNFEQAANEYISGIEKANILLKGSPTTCKEYEVYKAVFDFYKTIYHQTSKFFKNQRIEMELPKETVKSCDVCPKFIDIKEPPTLALKLNVSFQALKILKYSTNGEDTTHSLSTTGSKMDMSVRLPTPSEESFRKSNHNVSKPTSERGDLSARGKKRSSSSSGNVLNRVEKEYPDHQSEDQKTTNISTTLPYAHEMGAVSEFQNQCGVLNISNTLLGSVINESTGIRDDKSESNSNQTSPRTCNSVGSNLTPKKKNNSNNNRMGIEIPHFDDRADVYPQIFSAQSRPPTKDKGSSIFSRLYSEHTRSSGAKGNVYTPTKSTSSSAQAQPQSPSMKQIQNINDHSKHNGKRRSEPDLTPEVVKTLSNGELKQRIVGSKYCKEIEISYLNGIVNEFMRTGLLLGDFTFDKIIGCKEAVNQLITNTYFYQKFSEEFKARSICPSKGILLFGPPGNGKTILAKAVANQCKHNFISVSSATLISKYVGDSEKIVQALFAVAKTLRPCIIFIDEADSLMRARSDNEKDHERRFKNQLIAALDGISGGDDDQILVLVATNMMDDFDMAFVRRFVPRIYIGMPEFKDRVNLIKLNTTGCENDLSEKEIKKIAKKTEYYSASDIKALCNVAKKLALDELLERAMESSVKHFGRERVDEESEGKGFGTNNDSFEGDKKVKGNNNLSHHKLQFTQKDEDEDDHQGEMNGKHSSGNNPKVAPVEGGSGDKLIEKIGNVVITGVRPLNYDDFIKALTLVPASMTKEQVEKYDKYKDAVGKG